MTKKQKKNNKVKNRISLIDKLELRLAKNWVWMVLIAFIVGVLVNYCYSNITEKQHVKNYNKVKEDMFMDVREDDWNKLKVDLDKIKDKDYLKDVYYYFNGKLIMYNPSININGPEVYFSKINPESEFYLNSQKSLVFYYQEKYSDQGEQYRNELNKIAENLKNDGRFVSYYYYVKSRAQNQNDYNAFKNLYDDFKQHYKSVKDPNSFNNYYANKYIDTEDAVLEASSIEFKLICQMAIAASNNGLKNEKSELLLKIDGFLKQNNIDTLRFTFNYYFNDNTFVDNVVPIINQIRNN